MKNDGAAVYYWQLRLPNGAQSFVFCSQIVTEQITATFLILQECYLTLCT